MKATVSLPSILILFNFSGRVCSQANPPYFDGKACTSNAQCISNSCVSNICGKKLKITSLSKTGVQSLIEASYFDTFGTPGVLGVVADEDSIKIQGKVRAIYKLPSSFSIHKFSSLKFRRNSFTNAQGAGICVYQSIAPKFDDNQVRCMVIGTSDVTTRSNVISSPQQLGERTNLALGKFATQSSNYNIGGSASKAVDGNTYAQYDYNNQNLNTITHTESEFNPWWRVDLGSPLTVREVRIYKRLDGYNGRLFDFSISGLDNNEAVVYSASWQTNPAPCVGTTITTTCSTNDIIYIFLPITTPLIRHFKITLNGSLERVLSLAEVIIYGTSSDFLVPIGKLTNAPMMNIDRIAFFQDNFVGAASSEIQGITFIEGQDEPIYTADFSIVTGVSNLNIQGVRTITRSNNGACIAVKDINNTNRILVYVNSNILDFIDPFAVGSIALSDNGLMIASFESANQGFVRLLKIDSKNISNKSERVSSAKFGSGVSITPTGTRVAVGSPLSEKVFVYDINPNTLVLENLKEITIPIGMTTQYKGSYFGDKVGISATGKTIAVAAPKYKESNLEIGAVFLYSWTETSTGSSWVLQKVVKGSSSNLQFGVAGLAVDDATGRFDITNLSGDTVNLKFAVSCNSMYAKTTGKDSNYFIPVCRCLPGYKTNDGGRILINPKDVCLPCSNPSAIECNDQDIGQPGTQPTSSPTKSAAPSSLSGSPSVSPSVDENPSSSPSMSPSFSEKSLYDGDFCRFDIECFIQSCVNTKCKSKAFEFKSNGVDVTAEVEPVGFSSGGIIVEPLQPKIMNIYGTLQKRLKLSDRVLIASGTALYISFGATSSPSSGLRLCFFETAGTVNFDSSQQRCKSVESSGTQKILLDSVFNGKTTYIQFIGISQTNGYTNITELKFVATGDIIENDRCRDPNADLLSNECYCRPGYVTAGRNPLKQLLLIDGIPDVCVSCLETLSCGFDGDDCSTAGDCYDNACASSSTCEAPHLNIERYPYDDVTASLVPKHLSPNSSEGGVVNVSNGSVNIFGDTYRIYQMNRNITIDRYTQMKLNARKGDLSATGTAYVCIFLSNEITFVEETLHLPYGEKRCVRLQSLSTSMNNFIVNIGEELFNYRRVENVFYIGFKQIGSSDPRADVLLISNVKFEQSESVSFIDVDGKCTDDNRDSDTPVSEGKCLCKSGYVNSNGGRILINDGDTCVPCAEPCVYDGGNCTHSTDCFSGRCDLSSRCEAPPIVFDYKGSKYMDTVLESSIGNFERGAGVYVSNDAQDIQQIEIEGNAYNVYKLIGPAVSVNKFYKIRFSSNKRTLANTLELCFYDSSVDFECESYCYHVTTLGVQQNTEITAAEIFSSRNVNVTHIGFRQTCSNCVRHERSYIYDIQFVSLPTKSSIINGECTDNNAVVVANGDKLVCACTDGYISSFQGKVLGDLDACINCIGGIQCNAAGIDGGELCSSDLHIDLRLGGLQADPTVLRSRILGDFFVGLDDVAYSQGGFRVVTGNPQIKDSVSINLIGKAAKKYALQVPYTINRFSRLILDFVRHDDIDDKDTSFVAICLEQLAATTRPAAIRCYALEFSHPIANFPHPLINLNVALGKPAFQSTTDGDNIASHAVDGNTNFDLEDELKGIITSTVVENFPFWEVDLEGTYVIDYIIIHFIPDETVDKLIDYNVIFYDTKGDTTFNYYGGVENENPTQSIAVPFNIVAAKVRIILNMIDSNGRVLSLVEVEVFQRPVTASRMIDIPLGTLTDGLVVDNIAFVQTGSNVNMISNLSNITLIYGTAPTITESPTISPGPSASLQPSQSSSPTGISSFPTSAPSAESTEANTIGTS